MESQFLELPTCPGLLIPLFEEDLKKESTSHFQISKEDQLSSKTPSTKMVSNSLMNRFKSSLNLPKGTPLLNQLLMFRFIQSCKRRFDGSSSQSRQSQTMVVSNRQWSQEVHPKPRLRTRQELFQRQHAITKKSPSPYLPLNQV